MRIHDLWTRWVLLLMVGLASLPLAHCGGSQADRSDGAAEAGSHAGRTLASERGGPNRSTAITLSIVRALEHDIPEVSVFEDDVVRIEQEAMAAIRAKARAPAGPQTMLDEPRRRLDGLTVGEEEARGLTRREYRVLLAGFSSPADDSGPSIDSLPEFGQALGLLATDMSDAARGSTHGPIESKLSEEGVKAVMTMEFGTSAAGARSSAMSFEFEMTKNGATLSCKAALKAEGDPCPDPTGNVPFKYSVNYRCDVATGAKKAGKQGDITGTATGHVNDAAYVASFDWDAKVQSAAQRPASHDVFVEMAVKGSEAGSLGGTADWKGHWERLREGSAATTEDRVEARDNAFKQVRNIIEGYLGYLEAKWRDGYCVEVKAPVPGTVRPGSSTSIDLSVHQKRDGAVIKAPVDATLKGQSSLTPGRVDPSPGKATYVAPGQAGARATLTFTSTSRRGIGTLDAEVEVGQRGYTAEGGQGIRITGTVCGGVSTPFTLEGRPPDGSHVTFNYTPANDTGGTYTYSGVGGLFRFSGKGTYSMSEGSQGTRLLKQSDSGCMDNVPGGCASYTNTVTLTPTDSCGR